jgi:hypothetical protein
MKEKEINQFTLQDNESDVSPKNVKKRNFDHLEESDDEDKTNSENNKFKKNNTNINKIFTKNTFDIGGGAGGGSNNYINNISEPNEDDNLFDIIYKLKHNTNLNILIKTINKILINEKKHAFDKNDMTIILTAKELDKFTNQKNVNKNFSVEICYSLYEQQ